VDESKETRLSVPAKRVTFKKTPKLDVGAFGTAMHTLLKDNVVGYMLQVRKTDQLVYNLIWNYAQTPADGNKGWNENTRMHVASVSKYLTAVSLVKLLDAKKISYDAKIADYLPTHWSRGANIDKITFRHLLTHRSGFSTGGSSSDYAFMKQRVANGVPAVGGYDYENMNFGLMRILIPIINGDVPKTASFVSDAALNDQAWDAVTLYHFKSYMQAKVFSPAGVSNVGFSPAAPNALAYKFPNTGAKGWNSGDLASVAGGAAFRLSTKELLDVMGAIRRKNTIIPADKAQYILDNYFGIDQVIETPAGKIYNKNGAWGTGDGKTEQCVAYFMPDDVEIVVFVNSKIGAQDFSLRGLVKDVYINSLAE
jgi:CubicO group peptidase (beta-lactamase class C family)